MSLAGRTPQLRLQLQFVDRRNQAADVVANQLAQHLVLHRNIRLGSRPVAELRLDHRECRFDVRPLVIAAKELLLVQLEVEEELFP